MTIIRFRFANLPLDNPIAKKKNTECAEADKDDPIKDILTNEVIIQSVLNRLNPKKSNEHTSI